MSDYIDLKSLRTEHLSPKKSNKVPKNIKIGIKNAEKLQKVPKFGFIGNNYYNNDYIQWIKEQKCAVLGYKNPDFHHLIHGKGIKLDCLGVPLSREAHSAIHHYTECVGDEMLSGYDLFYHKYALSFKDLVDIASDLWEMFALEHTEADFHKYRIDKEAIDTEFRKLKQGYIIFNTIGG